MPALLTHEDDRAGALPLRLWYLHVLLMRKGLCDSITKSGSALLRREACDASAVVTDASGRA
jgi:hypothetical protein